MISHIPLGVVKPAEGCRCFYAWMPVQATGKQRDSAFENAEYLDSPMCALRKAMAPERGRTFKILCLTGNGNEVCL